MRLRTLGLLAAVASGLVWAEMTARADSLDPVPNQVNVHDNGNGTLTLSIDMSVSSNSAIRAGDEFSLYDVPGLASSGPLSSTVPSAAWTYQATELQANALDTFVIQNGGVAPDASHDGSVLYNIVFKYIGPPATQSGDHSFGTFSFTVTDSLASFLANLQTVTLSTGSSPGLYGGASYENGTSLTSNNLAAPVSVPLPSAAAMGLGTLAALAGLAGVKTLRRRRFA